MWVRRQEASKACDMIYAAHAAIWGNNPLNCVHSPMRSKYWTISPQEMYTNSFQLRNNLDFLLDCLM